ncbi:hypothetical protein ACWCRD_36280 [Streptomyces sp. NPDC002092]
MRPGDQLTIDAKYGKDGRYEAGYGDIMRSSVFTASGRLRMVNPLLTTAVTISCEAQPGTYPVLLHGAGGVGQDEHPIHWARVRVEPAAEAARRACHDKVKKLPRPNPEERWAAGAPWPQSEWDVRTFRAGSHITITGSDAEASGGDSLTSRAFTDRPVLRDGKAAVIATATLKCDAAPGLYVVYRHEVGQTGPAKPWARLRVTGAARGKACSTEQTAAHSAGASRLGVVAWTVGGTLLAGVAGALFLRARSRRGNSE